VPISGRNLADALTAPLAPASLAVGAATVDLARQVVYRDGHETRLRPRTADVLTYLVAHAGAVVTKQAIIDAVWGGVAVTNDSLVQCLVEIRRALGPDHDVIRTVRGRGYLLELPAGTALAADARQGAAHFWRALALPGLGDQQAAMAAAIASRQAVAFTPTWLVGYLHAQAGRRDEAREVLRAVEAHAAATYVPAVDLALLYAAAGEHAHALDTLERGHRERGRWFELLAVLPPADPLRAEPRFKSLLRALRLPDRS
jgi:DNA-binding winged helix-turn-helix (wHTH) protein